ncbi:hypothetical protein Vlu01_33350 [Micromonospora lutea]|uniref:Uncharacterized protein n=1 Tax=Micromonospora lutea TaxID=419825 RepID=A0ABQ4IXS9_9ACTN|nr:hypothetical protein Vlu01_33350 [Micromonospora lutea]
MAETRVAGSGTGTTAADAAVGTASTAATVTIATVAAPLRCRRMERHDKENLGTLRLQSGRECT